MKTRLFELYPALASIPGEELDRALENAHVARLKPGAAVFEELQACNAFPFVLSGALRVVKRSAETGREIALYHVHPGDACAVTSACLLGDKPYNAMGLVQAECELLMVPRAEFTRLLANEVFREFIFSLFAKRVLDLMLLVDEVAFRKLDQRIARLLITRGPSVQSSHQELADELGTVREMVTRILSGFADRGLVRLNRGSIQVIDMEEMKRLAGSV